MIEKFDFVRNYVRLLSRITDAPREFQESAAMFLISTAVGRKWVFKSIPDATIFDDEVGTGKLLNLWFILMGKSRITRKSSGVIKHVEEISKRVIGELRRISEAFTPESLIKELSEKSGFSATRNYVTACFWTSDEIAGFFQHLKKRDSYMVSADAFLSKIYDGSTYSRATIGRGKETVWNPYLTCLLASTDYLPTLFDELQIRLGFMNRFIYVVGERKQRKPLRTKPLTEEEKKEAHGIEDFLKALVERTSVTMLEMTTEAKQVYDSFEEEIEKRIETEDLGIKDGYCGQLPNFVVRFSCLYRLSRMLPEEIRNYTNPVLTVEKQDVERAIDYVQKAWNWFEKVIDIMLTTPTMKTRRLRDQAKDFITDLLQAKELTGGSKLVKITANQIGISIPTAYNALKELSTENRICSPKFSFYKLKEDCRTCKWRETCTAVAYE